MDSFKLVEESSGIGSLQAGGERFEQVGYRISRYQGFGHNGLPIPGLHRIEGRLDLSAVAGSSGLIGKTVSLSLESGGSIKLSIAGGDGRVLAEGHGPSRCSCC